MNETPYFFTHNEQQLFAVCHHPEGTAKKTGWVFCHPFAEEKLWAHRVFVNMARELSTYGYPVLRFDYRGYGDSDGQFEDYTVDDQVGDIQAAVNELTNQHPELDAIGLIGLRYGAVLATLAAKTNDKVSYLVLWDPIVDMDRYMQDVLRANLTTQMVMHGKVVTKRDELTQQILDGQAVNIDGYDLTQKLFEPASQIKLSGEGFKGKCQVVQIGRKNQPLKKEIEHLADSFVQHTIDQVVEEQFWKEIKNFVQRSDALSNSLISWIEEVGCE